MTFPLSFATPFEYAFLIDLHHYIHFHVSILVLTLSCNNKMLLFLYIMSLTIFLMEAGKKKDSMRDNIHE